MEENLLGILNLMVGDRTNKELIKKVSEEEVREVVFSMGAFKAQAQMG